MAGDRRLSRPDSSLPDWEVPDTSYRPIPIVWFAGAFLLQMGVLFALFVLLSDRHGYFTIGGAAIVSTAIGAWTWDRGMKSAPNPWKVATVGMLSAQFLLVCVAALPRA